MYEVDGDLWSKLIWKLPVATILVKCIAIEDDIMVFEEGLKWVYVFNEENGFKKV